MDVVEIGGILVKFVCFLVGYGINFCYWLWYMFLNIIYCFELIVIYMWLIIFVLLYIELFVCFKKNDIGVRKNYFYWSVNFFGFNLWCEFKFNLNLDLVLFLIVLI